jgi:putative transposase
LKRALAVKNTLAGRPWKDVAEELGVGQSFIGKWRHIYHHQGVEGLKLGYKGSSGYLPPEAREDVMTWLQKPQHWNIGSLRAYISRRYGVEYHSRQSYYALLHEAKLSWKKSQKRNPKADPEKVKATRDTIKEKTTQEALAIVNKETVVLFVDECHLLWGDTLGYVWGPRGERIEIPIMNERERQTYYGAVNLLSGSPFVMPAQTGNSEHSVMFLKILRRNFQGRRLVILWDRAPYHRGDVVKAYLKELNGDRPDQERLIHLEYFAPHAPEQNPMEDVWLAAKRWIRKHFLLFETFEQVKHQFVNVIHDLTLKTTKFEWYWTPQMI